MPRRLLFITLLLAASLLPTPARMHASPHAIQRATRDARSVPAPKEVWAFARRRPKARELGADGRVFPKARGGERPREVRGTGPDDDGRALRDGDHQRARKLARLEKYKDIQRKARRPAHARTRTRDRKVTAARSIARGKDNRADHLRHPFDEVGSSLSSDAHRAPLGIVGRPEIQDILRQHDRSARPILNPDGVDISQELVRQNARHAIRGHRRRRSFITSTWVTITTATGTPSRKSRRRSPLTRFTTSGIRRSSTTYTSRAHTARGFSCRPTCSPSSRTCRSELVEGYTELGHFMADRNFCRRASKASHGTRPTTHGRRRAPTRTITAASAFFPRRPRPNRHAHQRQVQTNCARAKATTRSKSHAPTSPSSGAAASGICATSRAT